MSDHWEVFNVKNKKHVAGPPAGNSWSGYLTRKKD